MILRALRLIPPLVWIAGILGLLCGVTGIWLSLNQLILLLQPSTTSPGFSRMVIIGLALGMLTGAGTFAVMLYSVRLHRAWPAPPPRDSLMRQLATILIPAALPLLAIALALVISPDTSYFSAAFAVVILAGLALAGGYLWGIIMLVDTLFRRLSGRWS